MERKYCIMWLQSVDSTNSAAQRRISELDNLSVVAARCQFAGRGQRGNNWQARPGENLTFSIVLRFGEKLPPEPKPSVGTLTGFPDEKKEEIIYSRTFKGFPSEGMFYAIPSRQQFYICMALTLALTDYLDVRHIHCRIKWPNDIYFNDKKICGILMENGVKGDRMASSVLGVGLNVNQTDFPDSLPNPVSMRLVTREKYDIEEELGLILRCFDERIMLIFSEEGRARLLETYLERLYRKNEEHYFIRTETSEKFRGIIRGITLDACLIVEDFHTGKREEFAFKEIKYVIDGREQV